MLSSCRSIGSQSLALISSGPQSGDKAIKLFELHRFLVEGEQFLVQLLGRRGRSVRGTSNSIATIPEGGAAWHHVALPKPIVARCRAMMRRAGWAAREFDAGLLDSQNRWHKYGLQL